MSTQQDADKAESLAAIAYRATQEAEAEKQLHTTVRIAKLSGNSWAEIGATLGITRQAAQQRFGTDYDR